MIIALAALLGLQATQMIAPSPSDRPSNSSNITELPKFTFRSFTAGEPVDPSLLKRCRHKPGGVDLCTDGSLVVAGHDTTTTVVAIGGIFAQLDIEQLTQYYPDLLDAFQTRYGQPCVRRQEQWQSQGGTRLTNSVITWCFKSGKLSLKSIGNNIHFSEAEYIDEVTIKQPTAPVDF